METSPKISVIIPVYNVSLYLSDCLESIINQTFKDLEIICINDGSTDNSLEILNSYALKDNRIKVINQKNSGSSVCRNYGIRNAVSEYISFIDSDDWIDLYYFEKLYKAIIKNNCDIAVSSIIRKRNIYEKYRVHYTEEKVYETLEEKIKICEIPKCCYVWNKLYKKEIIKDHFFTPGVFFQDVMWVPGALKLSSKLVTVPGINYYYRVNNNSVVKKPSPKKRNDRINSKKYIIKFFEENNLDLPEKDKYITRSIWYLFGIHAFKIKEYNNNLYYYLFGIKVFKKPNVES